MAKFSFLNGAAYARNDVFKAIGMDPLPKWGPFRNGYFEYDGAFFVFCNVGVPGRTGHDYPNRFDGEDLLWTGKTGSKRNHPSIMRMTSSNTEVHIFFRNDNREDFTYVGLGHAASVDDDVPVGIRWKISWDDAFDDALVREDADAPGIASTGRTEGNPATTVVNRYERSPAARAQCIKHFGAECKVCGMDFGRVYGSWGAGFIHVHHHVPISSIGTSYIVDPVLDLIPVCPNCHAMLHRKKTVISVDELAELLETASRIA